MTADFYEIRNRQDASPQRLVRTRSVASRVIAGETLIVPIRGKVGDLASIYSFNGTGSLIWQLLDLPRTQDELVSGVREQFDVDPERATQDVSRFVQEMFAAGLVEVSGSVAGTEPELGTKNLAEAS